MRRLYASRYRVGSSYGTQCVRELLPLIRMKPEAEKEPSFCLSIRVSDGKQIVHDFALIDKRMFG